MKLWEVTPTAKWNKDDELEESYVYCETKAQAIQMVRDRLDLPSKRFRAVEVTEAQVVITFYTG